MQGISGECLGPLTKKKTYYSTKLIIYLLILILILPIFYGLIIFRIQEPFFPGVRAASSWTQESETDFNNGTLDNVQIVGSGSKAELRLASGDWTNMFPTIPRPNGRYGHVLASDNNDDKVVMFGGWSGKGYLRDTWIWDQSEKTWTRLYPLNKPTGRELSAMASIFGTDKAVLFGGRTKITFNDTWMYDFSENNWTKMNPKNHPEKRSKHAMATIYGTDKVILFGGSGYNNETWVYDFSDNNWTRMNPIMSPPGRIEFAMAPINKTDEVVLFGGYNKTCDFNDTWIYNLSKNNWTKKSPLKIPEAFRGHTMGNIYGTDKIVLYGGLYEILMWNGYFYVSNWYVWIYDLSDNNWTYHQINAKLTGRYLHAMAPVNGTDNFVIYGGLIGMGDFSWETWIYDLSANTWWQKTYPRKTPGNKDHHSMAMVYGTDKIVLFGGGSYGSDKTWIYDLSDNTWTYKNPKEKPPGRYCFGMASIYGDDKVVIFGGAYTNPLTTEEYYFNDTWVYDLSNNTWTNKTTSNNPSEHAYNAMASVYGTDKIVMGGGFISDGYTWIYDYSENKWSKKTTLPIDPGWSNALYCPAMSTIFGTDKVLLFGGWAIFQGKYNNETWIYDLSDNKWIKKSPKTEPLGRSWHPMTYINGTDKVMLFGGHYFKYKDYYLNDTWIYDLSENNWTKMDPGTSPSVRSSHAMASVYNSSRVVIFGGFKGADETWIYDYSSYVDSGTFISESLVIGSNTSFKKLSCNYNTSVNTTIKFQLRSANNESNLLTAEFVGPDGTNTTYYTNSSSTIWSGHVGDQWIQYKTYFSTFNEEVTPSLFNITISYNCLPTTVLETPMDSSKISNNKPKFSWNFTDIDSGNQAAFQVLISNVSNFSVINYDSGLQNSSNTSWQFPQGTDYITLPDGLWYWKARTKDTDDDWDLYGEQSLFIIDTESPSSSISFPINNGYYNSLKTITGKAYDNQAGTGIENVKIQIKQVDENYYWSGTQWTTIEKWLLTTGTNSWTYDSSTVTWVSGEQYLIRSRATDNATNTEVPSSGIIINFDSGKPYSQIHLPNDKSYLNYLDTISGIAVDIDGSGLNKVEIEIERNCDNKFWDGSSWTFDECWLEVSGTEMWSYDCNNIPWRTDTHYSIYSRAIDNLHNTEVPIDEIIFMFDDQPPEPVSISINDDNKYTNILSTILSLTAKDTGSGVSQMAFSTNGIEWNFWEPFIRERTFTLPPNDGEKIVYFKVCDKANNTAITNDTIILDSIPPQALSIEINNGDWFTNSQEVELKLKAEDLLSGVYKIALSLDGDSWSTWESFKPERSITLPPMDGEKNIYFIAMDVAGNIAEPVSDTITLDTTSPENLSITINNNSLFTNSIEVTLALHAFDTLSGIFDMSISINNKSWSDWMPFLNEMAFNLPSIDGEKLVYLRVRDKAGNIAVPVFDSIILDTASPHTLSILINNGSYETNSTEIELTLFALDNLSGVYQMSLRSDNDVWTSWEFFSSERAFSLPPHDGEKIIYFRVIDRAGNFAEPVSASILLNTSVYDNEVDNETSNETDDNKTIPHDDSPEKETPKKSVNSFLNIAYMGFGIIIIIIILVLAFSRIRSWEKDRKDKKKPDNINKIKK